jgi:4-amino-4-deoxy-L-arabinose transferase-like glycosyltransferase
VVAAWGFLKAAETDKRRYLWFGALFVGLGFMIKMLQAYLLLPALFAVYFLGAKALEWQKIRNLAIAGGIILVVSLWWPLAVDLTPAAARPYVGSSSNNRVMDLIIGHNGAARLLGAGSRDGNGRPISPTGQGFTPPGFDEAAAELGITSAELIAAVGIPPDIAQGASVN